MIVADLAAGATSLAMAATSHRAAALVVLLGVSSMSRRRSACLRGRATEPRPDELVGRANALVAATSSAAYLAGPLLGGALLALGASPATVFVADALTFLFSAAMVGGIRDSFGRGSTQAHPGVLAGARLILRKTALLVPVVAGMVSLLGIGIAMSPRIRCRCTSAAAPAGTAP